MGSRGVREREAPYRRWVGKLGAGDTVVSFNYDLVVETARDAAGSLVVEVLEPADAVVNDVAHLKLHGSVDWRLGAQGIERSAERDFALRGGEKELVMASPGPTKQKVVQETLSGLWNLALTRISDAEVIVFVGYRFPPSDSQARRRLVTAITGNTSNRLALHVVLGPDTGHEHVLRLRGILEFAMASAGRTAETGRDARSSYDLRVHPLGAEDFLDLFVEGRLTQHS